MIPYYQTNEDLAQYLIVPNNPRSLKVECIYEKYSMQGKLWYTLCIYAERRR